jgi:hypothetical protein
MALYLLLSFFLGVPAAATTKADLKGQPSRELCLIRGEFRGAELARIKVKKRGREIEVDTVHWKVEVKDRSDASACPALGPVKVRVRGATFRGTVRKPEITYAVHVVEPELGSSVEMRVDFSRGKDTHTGIEFAEWFLKEVSGD